MRCLIMEIGEIIGDAIRYPLNHTKSLLIYLVLYFIMAVVIIFTGVGLVAGQQANNLFSSGVIGIVGLLLVLIISFLINGYGLDIVKFGINRSEDAPEIDIAKQVINGIKLTIVAFIYFIIPLIIYGILSNINQTLGLIIGLICFIIFGFALIMGECRLANTESIGAALNMPEALKDLQAVGIVKTLAIIVIILVVAIILNWIGGLFANMGDIGSFISAILSAIIGAYTFFLGNRAAGLLYSDIA